MIRGTVDKSLISTETVIKIGQKRNDPVSRMTIINNNVLHRNINVKKEKALKTPNRQLCLVGPVQDYIIEFGVTGSHDMEDVGKIKDAQDFFYMKSLHIHCCCWESLGHGENVEKIFIKILE